jgi:hypothetical protein
MVHGKPEDPLSFEQSLNGVSEVVTDASYFSVFCSLNESGTVAFHHCDRKNFLDGCNATLEWTETSVGASNPELTLKGIFFVASSAQHPTSCCLQACPSTLSHPHANTSHCEQSGQAEPTKYVVDAALAAQDAANQADAPGFAPDAALPSSVVSVISNSSYSSSASDGSDPSTTASRTRADGRRKDVDSNL